MHQNSLDGLKAKYGTPESVTEDRAIWKINVPQKTSIPRKQMVNGVERTVGYATQMVDVPCEITAYLTEGKVVRITQNGPGCEPGPTASATSSDF